MNGELALEHIINISISDDKLAAYLSFVIPEAETKFSLEQLQRLLEQQHIVHGVQQEKLMQIVRDPKQFVYDKTVIAIGTPPEDGADGRIRFLFDLDGTDNRPQEMEDGRVDYKEVKQLNNVKKGQLIAERIPAEDGTAGRAVTGEQLFPKKGKEARFKIGKNVVTDPDNLGLYATIDGLVTKTDKDKVNVFPVYEVNGDVDYNIGNIDFIGTVVIRGNVLSGFRVKASGDIRIVGGVEAAEIEAGGSVEITAGILGHNKGIVKAERNVKCSFVQDATVIAGEEVLVSQSILHSQVRAGKNIICAGSKGLIVGGLLQAGERVAGRVIGNTMSTVTMIEVGVLPELRNELAELRNHLKVINDNLDKTEKALTLLDQIAQAGQLSGDKLAMRIKLQNTKKQTVDEQHSVKERILEIEKSLMDTEHAKVDVISVVYPGTKITIGRYVRFVKDSTPRISFRITDGDIGLVQLI